ncbi:reverse transcriptase domain-containing protein [Tanacetum coccineum]
MLSKMNATSSKTDERIDKLADQLSTLSRLFQRSFTAHLRLKAVEESCVTCGGAHSWYNCPATDNNQANVCATTGTYNQVNPPNRVSNQMAPPGFALWNDQTEEATDKEQTNFQGSTAQIPPPVIPISIPELDIPKTLPKTTPILESDISKSLPKPNISYPSRRDDQKSRDKASNQMEKIFQIFQDLRFDISFADALLLMPRFAPTIKSLLMNKEKLLELAKILLNENCSGEAPTQKLPKSMENRQVLIYPCNFSRMDVCHALADLSASINLMPLSIWKKLSLPELTPTQMTLKLADRSITHPKGLAEDIFVKVGNFHFPTDFVVVDFIADPRVPLILGRSFLRTSHALIDVYEGELVLRDGNEQITFHVNGTSDSKNVLPSCDDFSSIKNPRDDYVTFSNPLFEFDVNSSDINPLFDEELEDIECKDSYDSNLDKLTFLVIPLSESNKDGCLAPEDDIEILLHNDPSTPLKSVASILKGFINDPPFEENENLFDLECKTNDAPIDEAECFDPGGDNDEIDVFLAIKVHTYIEGYYDSEGDVFYLESLLSENTTHNLSPDSDPIHHEFTGELITIPPGIFREREDYINRIDPNREEIDIFSGPDDSIPPGIESDFDSEEDIIDNLLNNDPIHERLTFNIEPNAPVINNVDELNEDECFDPGGGKINVEIDNSFTFVTRIFLPYLTYPEVSPLPSSTKNEDTIFDPGIST